MSAVTEPNEVVGVYELTHVNGKAPTARATLTFSRQGSTVSVFVAICNTMNGILRFEDKKLFSDLRSTMMMGSEEEAKLEQIISAGFGTGFDARHEDGKLVLKNDYVSLFFARRARLDELFGDHIVLYIDNQTPSDEFSMKFTDDGNGGCFVIANIGNSLRGHCTLDAGVLRSELVSTNVETDSTMAEIEHKIIAGFRSGFKVRRCVTGIILKNPDTGIQLMQVVTKEALWGEYLLRRFNGEAPNTSQQSTIAFEPESESTMKVYIVVANRIRGSATLNQNTLRSDEPLKATRVAGTEAESRIESAYNAGFQYGLDVILHGKELILRDTNNLFIFSRTAEPQPENGAPTYKGTFIGKCFKNQGNGLLFRIVNSAENKWAFYNDTKLYRMRVTATFGARSKIKALGRTTLTKSNGKYVAELTIYPLATEMFIEGTVNGFKVSYDAEQLDDHM